MRLARLLPVLCVVFCAASPAHAETAGQVLAAVGDALALRTGQIVRLVAGASIEPGDQIHTGASSYLQIRFTDWGVVTLRPRTDFVVDEYVYEARQGGRERAFFSLLNGGIRSLTGAIGHRDRANYRLRTPITTIGIRGTYFSVLMCKQDCRNPDGTPGEDGLYGEVFDGRIAVSPYGGGALEREFGVGERFRLDNEHSVPLQLPSLPPFFPDGLDSQARSGAKPGSAISSAGRVVPGVTGGLVSTLTAIVPAKPGTRAATDTVVTPLAKGVLLPAAELAGSMVNSALSMPALGPAFPLLGTLPVATPTLPITTPTLPVTTPTLPVTTPTLPVTTPTLPVTTPTLPVTTPTLPVTTPTLPVTTPTLPLVGTPSLPTVPSLPLGAIAPLRK